jgi:pyruvate dehydrogenase E1 component alpha subunit
VNEGEFHEALNLASVWKLPVLFINENNLYGMGTDVRRVSAVIEIYKRADAYAMPAEQVDGMDVLEVYSTVSRLARRIRAGEGPAFIEAICYRFRGHSMADAELYRTKQEVEQWRILDPIRRLSEQMLAEGTIQQSDIDAMQARADEMADEAARFAEESAPPALDTLRRYVYKERDSA